MDINKTNVIRIAGLIGSAAAAAVAGLQGDYVTAFGIIAAALSAPGLKTTGRASTSNTNSRVPE